jgi:hypothetical protein
VLAYKTAFSLFDRKIGLVTCYGCRGRTGYLTTGAKNSGRGDWTGIILFIFVLRKYMRSEMRVFDWGARIFAGEDGKVVDPAKGFWWKGKGKIVEGRAQGAETRGGGAGRRKRRSENGKELLEHFGGYIRKI